MLDKLIFRCFFLVCVFVSVMSTDPRCSAPFNAGEGDSHELRYFFDSNQNVCNPFFFKGGVEDTLNSFVSDKDCMLACSPERAKEIYPEEDKVCSLPVDLGSCYANHLKYHYDSELKVCRLFHYGGCQGNGNRFDTKEQCAAVCKAKAGRMGEGGAPDFNPDESRVNAGLIVGVLGGVVFAVAVIAAIALFFVQRKKVTTEEVEMGSMS